MGNGTGPRNLSFSSPVTEGNSGLLQQVSEDIPWRPCHTHKWASPKQTAKRVEVLPFSLCLRLNFLQEICPLLGPGATVLGSWDATPGSGRGCCGQLCSLCTAQNVWPRGQEGAGILRWCGHRFLISTEVPDVLAVTLGLGINSLRSVSASHFWDICFGVSAQRPGGVGSSWCVSPGLTSSQL